MPDNSIEPGRSLGNASTYATGLKLGNSTTGQKGGNPWHDPKTGQFTSGPVAGTAAQGNSPADVGNEIVVTATREARDAARKSFQTQGTRPPRASHVKPAQLLAAIEQTGRLSARLALLHAEHAAGFRDTLIAQYGLPAPLATAMAANAELESGLNASVTERGNSGHGQGLFQLTDPARKAAFLQFTGGTPIEKSTADQQIQYQIYELTHTERHTFSLAQRVGSDAASLAAGYSYYVERSYNNLQDSADRYAVAAALDKISAK